MSDSKPQNDPSMDDILASIRKIIADDEARAAAGPGFGSPSPPQRPMQPAPPRSPGVAATGRAATPGDDDDVLLLTDLIEEPPPMRPAARPVEVAPASVEPRPARRVVDESRPSAPTPFGISPIPSPAKPVVMDINEPQPTIISAPPPPRPVTPPPSVAPVPPVVNAPPPPPKRDVGVNVSATVERPIRVVEDTAPAVAEASAPSPAATPSVAATPVAASTPTAVGGKTVEDLVREMLRPMLQDWMDKNLPAMVEKHLKSEVERLAKR